MARELTIQIQVLSEQAEAKTRKLEQAFKDAAKAAGTDGFAKAEKQVEVAAKDAERAIDKLNLTVAKQKDITAGADKQTAAMLGTLRQFGAAIGISFGVREVIRFGQEVLADADALVKLSDKTGVSITGLQRFQVAGDDAGNTIEQITTSIAQMENRLASGDKSAVAALGKLGLSLEDLSRMRPENQFVAISDAIRGVQDPAQQVAIAMDLFGRQGAEILPTLKRGFDDVKGAAVGMSEETVRRLDEMGDSFTKLWRQTKNYTVEGTVFMADFVAAGLNPARMEVNALQREMAALEKQLQTMAKSIPAAPKSVAGPLVVPTSDDSSVQRWIKETDDALKGHTKTLKEVRVETDHVAEANERFRSSVRNLTTEAIGASKGFGVYGRLLPDLSRETADLTDLTINLSSAVDNAADDIEQLQREGRFLSASMVQTRDVLMTLPNVTSSASEALQELREGCFGTGSAFGKMSDAIMGSLSTLNHIFVSAFTGGGGMAGAVKAFATNVLDSLLSLIPGVGPILAQFSGAIVAGLSKIGGWIKGLFGGPSQEELAGRAMSATFEAEIAAGLTDSQRAEAGNDSWKQTLIGVRDAYLKIGLSAVEAERDVARLWEASKEGPDAVAAAIEHIKAVMDDAKRAAEGTANSIEHSLNSIDPDPIEIDISYKTPSGTPILGFDAEAPEIEGFAGGTKGQYRDFGRGTLVELHGRERVMTEAEGQRSASGSGPITVTVGQVTIQAGDHDDLQSLTDKFIEALRTQSSLYQGIAVIADRRISAAT